jgi:hypothetical protein
MKASLTSPALTATGATPVLTIPRADLTAARKVLNAFALTDSGRAFPRNLLTAPASNPKVEKNGKVGVLTAVLHLTPWKGAGALNLNGRDITLNTCAAATEGCIRACLHLNGNPVYKPGKESARRIRTRAYYAERAAFMVALAGEVAALERKALAEGVQPGIRLNGTSDLPFERVPVTVAGVTFRNLMQAFPGVEFYDYTKVSKRAVAFGEGALPGNYHITFSRSGLNDTEVESVLTAGGNVAAVFTPEVADRILSAGVVRLTRGGVAVPAVDGDDHDFRPVDGKGVAVILKEKRGGLRKEERPADGEFIVTGVNPDQDGVLALHPVQARRKASPADLTAARVADLTAFRNGPSRPVSLPAFPAEGGAPARVTLTFPLTASLATVSFPG